MTGVRSDAKVSGTAWPRSDEQGRPTVAADDKDACGIEFRLLRDRVVASWAAPMLSREEAVALIQAVEAARRYRRVEHSHADSRSLDAALGVFDFRGAS